MKLKDSLWIGIITGLIGPTIGVLLFYSFNFGEQGFIDFIFLSITKRLLSSLLSLCAVINLGLFYLFLNTNRLYSARGVILSTLIYGLVILVLKFIL